MNGPMKIASAPAAYSARQIVLHWIVFVLVAFQFAIGNQMSHLFGDAHGRESHPREPDLDAGPHQRRDPYSHPHAGAPGAAPHRRHSAAAEAAPGARTAAGRRARRALRRPDRRAYLWLPELAPLHKFMTRPILVALFALHFAGALWHWLVVRDDVMTRMVRPAK
jgi:hypothetical protein